MRKLLCTLALGGAILMGGCATTPNGGGVTIPSAIAFVNAVKAAAIQLCGFEPVLNVGSSVVAQLMQVYYPPGAALVQVAQAVAHAICASPDTVVTTTGRAVPGKVVSTPRGTIVVPGRYITKRVR